MSLYFLEYWFWIESACGVKSQALPNEQIRSRLLDLTYGAWFVQTGFVGLHDVVGVYRVDRNFLLITDSVVKAYTKINEKSSTNFVLYPWVIPGRLLCVGCLVAYYQRFIQTDRRVCRYAQR